MCVLSWEPSEKFSAASTAEPNEEDEANALLDAEATLMKRVFIVLFVILALVLLSLLGVTIGSVSKELFKGLYWKWITHPALHFVMLSSMRMRRKVIERTHALSLTIAEQVLFYACLLYFYLITI